MSVTAVDLWKLDTYTQKTKDQLSVQLELMIDDMYGRDKDELLLAFANIEGFLDGLMYACFITHFEHHDLLGPVVEAYRQSLELIDDSEVQT